MVKLLFPPIVPNSLPAFDSRTTLKYYFKPSVANSISEVQHLQMTIVRLDTNRTVLPTATYPHGILFKNKSEIKEDVDKGFWYVEIPSNIFPTPDIPYKIQIRLGETNITGMGSAALGTVLKDLDKMSEWSIVTMVMPITKPDFGIQSFTETTENRISSTGYVFVGYYEPKDANKQETLTSFRYNLFSYSDADNKNTWKLLSTSGEKLVGFNTNPNMEFTFPIELKEEQKYIVTMTVKSKNLYTSTKVYKIHSASYPVLEMFNSIDVVPNLEEAKMDITVRAKQILMSPKGTSTVRYIKDEPGNSSYPNLIGTHAVINGSVATKKDSFVLNSSNGIWVCQFKAMFPNIMNSLDEISKNPTVEITQTTFSTDESEYHVKIKVGCMKINLAYPTSSNLNPSPEWQYRFIIRKEVLVMSGGKEQVVLSQNKVVRQSGTVNPKQEYYFYIKEKNGLMEVDIKKTYLSTNTNI